MSSNTNGFLNETEMVLFLNNKLVSDLNENMKHFILSIFENVQLNNIIHAGKIGGQLKPDCYIEINGVKKNISLKMGSGNSVHQEPLSKFCEFLEGNGVSNNSINTLKLFHYGDGTTDGSGNNRISGRDFYNINTNLVNSLNIEINSNRVLLAKLFDRFLFTGVVETNPTVNVVYHGTIENGIWATKEEVTNYLLAQNTKHTGIYFSSLSYQVWNRCINHNPKTENRRHTMQIKWGSMVREVAKIIEGRTNNANK